MSPPRTLRVFLCHASDHKPAVRALYRRLLKEKCDPWLDDEKLLGGQHFPREISKAVKESHVVIVCLSKSSITKRGFVQKEIKVALDAADELPEGTVFIIPVRLEVCEVPDRLSELHRVDLFARRGFERLKRALKLRAKDLGITSFTKSKRPSRATANFGSQRALSSKIRPVSSLTSNAFAIDFGEANTLICTAKSIVLAEPSLVLINKRSHTVEYIGRAAKDLTKHDHMTYSPVREGSIVNPEIAGTMLRYFLAKACGETARKSVTVLFPVNSGLEPIYSRAFIDTGHLAKASSVYLVERIVCAAVGAGLPVREIRANLVVSIGAGITEIGVIALSGIVHYRLLRIAGNDMDGAISEYIKRKHKLLIGARTAEALKIELGSAFPLDEELSYEIRGRALVEGTPKSIVVTDEEIREALNDCVSSIIKAVRLALERTPPELSANLQEYGITLTGGCSLLNNFPKRLSLETGVPVSITKDPLATVAQGAAEILANQDLLRLFTL